MTTIDPKAPILVTGATGYVAGRLVETLLRNGHTVHATVRDPKDRARLQPLELVAKGLPGSLRFFRADLMEAGSFAAAMAGCELVFHTASPFIVGVKDPEKQLVEPARLGTRHVLDAANRTPSVKRVVITSSCAAIYGDNADLEATPAGVFTEEVWNTSSSLRHQAYSYSKTVAEREAWDIAGRQSRWDLVVVNPSLVLGPGIGLHHTSESFKIMKQQGDGTLRAGTVRLGTGVVDVRDLAEAHYLAGFTPGARGRYIVSGHNSDFAELAGPLRQKFGKAYPFPTRMLPKWLVWLVGPLANEAMTRETVRLNVGRPWKADNSKGIRELGLSYRPLQETLVDFFQQLVDEGAFARRG